MKYLNLFESFNGNESTDVYKKFIDWFCGEKDFDLYSGEEDFHKKFNTIVNSDISNTEKAETLSAYLDLKWGLYDGYDEVVEYLENLLNGNLLESVDNSNSKAAKMIKNKSKDSGISQSILKKVYKRGRAAWNSGHRPGTPQEAWATGRVNSFITGKGGARKADSDLWKKAKESKKKKK